MEELQGLAMLELDRNGDCLYTYVYPKMDNETRTYTDSKLQWNASGTEPTFVWGRTSSSFVYILHSEPLEHNMVSKCACVLTAEDCHPTKYRDLAQVFLDAFIEGDFYGPRLVELFTLVSIKGRVKKAWSAHNYGVFEPTETITLAGFISQFQLDFILVVTALLLRKRVAIVSPDAKQLEHACLCVAMLAPPPRRWSLLYPLLKGQDVQAVEGRSEFIAGFSGTAPSADTYDILVDVPNGDIRVSPSSQDSFVMGRFHKDMATEMLAMAQEGKSTQKLLALHQERVNQLNSVLDTVKDDAGKVSLQSLKEQKMSNAMRTFCANYARAHGLL